MKYYIYQVKSFFSLQKIFSFLIPQFPNFAQKSSELPDIKNVELMSPDKFADLIGYEGKFRSAFFETIGLAKESIYDLKARLILRRKAVKNLRIIKETFPFKEKEFLDFIKKSNQGNLLN